MEAVAIKNVCVAFSERTRAAKFERYLKSASGRAFIMKHL